MNFFKLQNVFIHFKLVFLLYRFKKPVNNLKSQQRPDFVNTEKQFSCKKS